jgi:hypothetical protein
MPNTLIFPDGIRLANRDEIPGSEPVRSQRWARIQAANIAPGFTLEPSGTEQFLHYAEINVDAPDIWAAFRDLCEALLGTEATLLFADIDADPAPLGSASVSSIIATLEPHAYRLAHNGFLQFGLVGNADGKINEVFVAPTKHFKIWLNDETRFRSIMRQHGLREADALEFLDEYPHTTVGLQANTHEDVDAFRDELANKIAALPSNGR